MRWPARGGVNRVARATRGLQPAPAASYDHFMLLAPKNLVPAILAQRSTGILGMNQQHTVTVYNFRTLEFGVEMSRLAGFKATRERIASMGNAVLLEGTEESVPVSELDAQGHFRRMPTGWGEL